MSSLRDELFALLAQWSVLPASPSGDERLITSGTLDSTALFELSLWVEERVGRPLDPATFDVVAEWDTADGIVAFVERARNGDLASPAATALAPVQPTRRSPAPEYEIRTFEPGDRPGLFALYSRLWSSDAALNARFFEWRYERNPAPGAPLVYVATYRGELIATRAAFPSVWTTGPDDPGRTWFMSDDLVVLKGHESRGIFAGFADAIAHDLGAAGHRFFISLSALRVTRLQSLSAGARDLGGMKPVGRLPTIVSAFDSLRDATARLPLAWRLAAYTNPWELAARSFARLDRRPNVEVGGITVSVHSAAPTDEMAEVCAAAVTDARFRMRRDARFLAWRYSNPLHEYRFLLARQGGRTIGYLVLERTLSDLGNARRVNVADWEGQSGQALSALLSVAADSRPAELVSWTETFGELRNALLESAGFHPVDLEQRQRGLPSILVWPLPSAAAGDELREAGKSLLELRNWDLRMLYTSLA